jgi:Flp pilus assembly protein TadD
MSRRRKQHHPPPQPRSAFSPRLLIATTCAALVVLTWLVFGQTLGHEFVNFDDHKYVYENPHVIAGLTAEGVQSAFTEKVSSNWHPLTMLSHMLDAQLFGLHPGWHHFTNLVLHTAAVLLLFGFLRDATGALWQSAFVATIFAIHPLRAESVAWVSERKDVLSGVFFMLTLWAYLHYVRQPKVSRYVVVALLLACGLMAKPMLVTVPLVLLLLDFWPFQRAGSWWKLVIEKLPLLALSAAASVIALLMQSKVLSTIETLSIWRRLANGLLSYLTYIVQLFWPMKLSPFYPHPMDLLNPGVAIFSLLLLIGATTAALLFARTRRYILVGWLWYLIMLLPVLGILQVGLQAHADRYTYLPHIGLYLVVAWGVAELAAVLPCRRLVLGSAAALSIVACATRAWSQAGIWHDSEKLWRHAIAVTNYNYVAHGSLAKLLWSKKRIAEAIPHFQEALRIAPDDAEMHNTVGLGLIQTGKPSEAIAHWKKALQVDPQDLNAQSNLAWVFATCPERVMRDGARAVELARSAIEQSGERTPILLRTLAAAYAEAGRFSEAVATAREGMELASAQGHSGMAAELRSQAYDYQLNMPLRDASLAGVQPVEIP